ncbi:MAG TPA: zinc-ribbon domain-containing protein [Candidatus Angelobacter sp.]|jgi:hypothetical protein
MLCTFCGTENRPEYKFCGSCGVRLDRRQTERRANPGGASTKCIECGYVNEPGMKFCGMCGSRVERRMQERRNNANEPRAAAIANAQLPTPDIHRRAATQVAPPPAPVDIPEPFPHKAEPAIFKNGPLNSEPRRSDLGNGRNISGPSFLGLNSQHDTADGVEYLLEDEPTGGGLRKLLLLVIIVAILGLVFVQWRSSFRANPKPAKTDPTTSPSPVPQGANDPPSAAPTEQLPQSDAKAPVTSASTSDGVTGESTDKKADYVPPKDESIAATTPVGDAGNIADKKPASDDPPAAAASKPTEEARLSDYKPSAALVRAQQFIRGTGGVAQNCEQGLIYLHAATDKNDPGAAIQMGALYSSGLCVKQDRVMAYRWFNSAHELQPANMWIQKNMDQLWAQMTSQERRLAGY